MLVLLAEDSVTMARLVELTCIATTNVIGGAPENLTDPQESGPVTTQFRVLAQTGLDGANAAMFELCARMSPPLRGEPPRPAPSPC